MNTFDLTLDLSKRGVIQTVQIRQGDQNGTTIVATITDHGVAASTSGMTARFSMRLPNGTEYYRKAASLSGNVATVTIDEAQAASAVGRTDVAYFQLLQGSTVVASTESFTVVVLPDALADATVPESYDSAIQDAIDALDAAVADLPATVEDVLADHPEWTTTVQDGSITKAKLATDLARDRERLLYRLDNLLTNALPEGETATASDAAKTPMAALALYGRSTQDGTPTPSAPVAIESVEAPNLCPPLFVNAETIGGVTYTPNADGSFTSSGTATANSQKLTSPRLAIKAGTYRLSGCPAGGSTSSWYLRVIVYTAQSGGSTVTTATDVGGGATLTLASDAWFAVFSSVSSGVAAPSGTWGPMLNAGSTAYPYVPYGHAGLWARRTSDASVQTVTPIDLDGHELRSLPDGTRDEVTVDERGHAVLVQRVQLTTQAVTDGVTGTVGVDVMSSTGTIANGATVLYPLATPVTIDLGTIDPVPLVGPDLTAQAVPTAPFALTYERDLNVTLARLESAIANLV